MDYPLETPRLSISPLTYAELETFVSYRQDPAIARYQSWEVTYSIGDAQDLVSSQAGVDLPGVDQWLQLAIRHKETGNHVGDLALHNLGNQVFEIGFTIASAQQGQGFAKESASRLIRQLFDEGIAQVIVANTDARNSASIGLLTSLGFSQVVENGWEEEFKGEHVFVQHFVLNKGSLGTFSDHA